MGCGSVPPSKWNRGGSTIDNKYCGLWVTFPRFRSSAWERGVVGHPGVGISSSSFQPSPPPL
jgi:hypothetical protein